LLIARRSALPGEPGAARIDAPAPALLLVACFAIADSLQQQQHRC
jgi:hypothetical protein